MMFTPVQFASFKDAEDFQVFNAVSDTAIPNVLTGEPPEDVVGWLHGVPVYAVYTTEEGEDGCTTTWCTGDIPRLLKSLTIFHPEDCRRLAAGIEMQPATLAALCRHAIAAWQAQPCRQARGWSFPALQFQNGRLWAAGPWPDQLAAPAGMVLVKVDKYFQWGAV